uniref:Uncharacterized protein n=1 Tax=Arundo donax TaxID=35708 RepID=A0A0A9GCI2_ARUDO
MCMTRHPFTQNLICTIDSNSVCAFLYHLNEKKLLV